MLANVATPLLGLVDTAVIGNTGAVSGLGAIALGALIFNFVYWAFGFLRMGTTGFIARAHGQGDHAEVRAAATRGILLGAGFGLLLCLLQWPISQLALAVFSAGPEVEAGAQSYLQIRLWGAPASLATFAILGTLIGLARTGEVLRIQLLLNGLNIPLDLYFAGVLGWGVEGIALGTVLAEWVTLIYAVWRVHRLLLTEHNEDAEPPLPWSRIFDARALKLSLKANGDILLRTLILLMCFAIFVEAAARLGDITLAANHILLQFVTLSAYVLDGYAHAAEPLIGRAIGSRNPRLLRLTTRRSMRLACAAALLLGSLTWLAGPTLIQWLTDLPEVNSTAQTYLGWAVLYICLSFAAFQLDGIFIGAGATRQMRNTAIAAAALFLVAIIPAGQMAGYAGQWAAMVLYVVARAATLWLQLPALRRQCETPLVASTKS